MKTLCAVSLALLLFNAPAEAQQVDKDQNQSVAEESFIHDACFGDRYETDEDLNEGSQITDREIQLLLNPPQS